MTDSSGQLRLAGPTSSSPGRPSLFDAQDERCLLMTFADQVRDHKSRSEPRLVRLRLLACGHTDGMLPWQVAAAVRDAANGVIAEAEAAVLATLTVSAGGTWDPGAETFLWVRLSRLACAAEEAVSAARSADIPCLRRHLLRFDTLAAAIWAVR
ncbi:MAG TPA: hypothetical protein VMC03_22875 [Streptosporangiaceae bacterium]|nr:hypothetical protein [Streptosporangiaceae bacterium]